MIPERYLNFLSEISGKFPIGNFGKLPQGHRVPSLSPDRGLGRVPSQSPDHGLHDDSSARNAALIA